MISRTCTLALAVLAACGTVEGGAPDAGDAADAGISFDPTRFATRVESFTPGDAAGYGQDRLPGIVLGPPKGKGANAGSLDVLSLGNGGSIVLAFDRDVVDGDGPDLIVFENAFRGATGQDFQETGVVAASADGVTFVPWPCAADDAAGGFPGCAGVHPVLAAADNGVSPLDPATAGGDAFDLHEIGLDHARFVRITDTGHNTYGAPSGGFDLDAVSIVNVGP